MSQKIHKQILFIILVTIQGVLFSQNCGLKNPSFESYVNCPTGFSQFEAVKDWVNIMPDLISEPDYFNESCPNGNFGGFNYGGYSDVDGTVSNNNSQQRCGRVGMYLNKDTGDDARLKEFIAQEVALQSGVSYDLKLQIQKSYFALSTTLQRDLVVYGYTGAIPAAYTNYCPTGMVVLARLPHASITTSNQEFTLSFSPNQNFTHLVLGADCGGISLATATGYVFIDGIELSSTSNTSFFTPIIEHISNDSNYNPAQVYSTFNSSACKNCFSDFRNKMVLKGNDIPTGVTATWSQSGSNPELVQFSSPNSAVTAVNGATRLIPGFYSFYYSFSAGGCTQSDTLELEVKAPLFISAGPDFLNCGGNNDHNVFTPGGFGGNSIPNNLVAADFSYNSITLQSPTFSGGTGWIAWSRLLDDGSEHFFGSNIAGIPASSGGSCMDGIQMGSLNLRPSFFFSEPMDSVYFVFTVLDQCNTLYKDTMLYVVRDVNLRFDKPTYCLGDTALVFQIPLNYGCLSSGDGLLSLQPRMSFTWTLSDPALIAQNPNSIDSLRVTIPLSVVPGAKTAKLTIFDSVTNCFFYDEHTFLVKTAVLDSFSASPDIVFCNGNNDIHFTPANTSIYSNPFMFASRAMQMSGYPNADMVNENSYSTWWTMIREDGTEWTFTNPCGIPYDGADEGDVYAVYPVSNFYYCGNTSFASGNSRNSNSSFAVFGFRNARDTVLFVFNLMDVCLEDTTFYRDTMAVIMNDIDLEVNEQNYCYTDTVSLGQINSPYYRRLAYDSALTYQWTIPSDVYSVPGIRGDSLRVYFDYNTVRGYKLFRLTVTDRASGCTWFDEVRIFLRTELTSVDAGPDQVLCNNNFVNQQFVHNASPNQSIINSNDYKTYWESLLPNGTSYIFGNNAGVPFTGNGRDDGLITTYAFYTSGANAVMNFKTYGERKMVWHVIDYCDSTIRFTDTLTVKWDFFEPIVEAGPDQNPNCDATFLEGTPSASSSGTSGCFGWRQISGPDSLHMIDTNRRVAQVINLDLVTPGVYEVEYSLGCGFCKRSDTMTITINQINPPPFDMTWDTVSKICVEDSLTFTGHGGTHYQWYVNDSLIQKFSADSIFSVANSLDSIKVSVSVKDSINECYSFNQNLFHKFVGVICYAPRDTLYSCGSICVSTSDLPYGYDTLITCNSQTTPIGASYTLSDTCVMYNELTYPNTWLFDTLCVVLIDTVNDIYDTTDIFITNCDSSIAILCKDTTLYVDENGNWLSIDTSFVLDSVFASTGIDSVTLSNSQFNCGNIGLNSVSVTAYNTYYNNSVSCSAIVTILDTVKPIVFCHDTTLYLSNNGVVYFDTSHLLISISENCTLDSVWINRDSAICLEDTVEVTIYARDQSNNIGFCKALVFVKDTITPIVYCHDTTLHLQANGKVFFDTSAIFTGVNENCSINSIWMDKDSATCVNDTIYTLIYARDLSNNTGVCAAKIAIEDTIKPIVFCADTTLYLESNGKVNFGLSHVFLSTLENCTVDSIWLNIDSADCSQDRIQSTIYAIDNSGNIGNCVAEVTILDTLNPIVNCSSINVYLNTGGLVTIDSSNLNNGSTDNCGISTIKISQSEFDCTHVGNNSITMVVTDNSGNQDSCIAIVTVFDTNTYTAFAGNDTSYCSIYTITMNANHVTGRVTGEWLLDSTYSYPSVPVITNVNQPNTTIGNLAEGEYRFIWNVFTKSCFDLYDTVIINVYNQPTAILPTDIDLCYKTSIGFGAIPLSGSATGTWTNYLNSANIPTANYMGDSAQIGGMQQGGEYHFYFEASNGTCPVSRDSISVFKHYIPVPAFSTDTTEVCENGCITFTNLSTINPTETLVAYQWDVDVFQSANTDIVICFGDTGAKDVRLIATSNFGCKDTVSFPNYISVNPNPIADFSFSFNQNIGTLIQIQDQSRDAVSYYYDFGDNGTSTSPSPSYLYNSVGNVTISQIVTSIDGCKDTTEKTALIKELFVYVPNSFTPNNDGINDVFIPVHLGLDTEGYEFTIYNRWGEQIFRTTTITEGWDGSHKGIPVQEGVYVWSITGRKKNSGERKKMHGHVTVLGTK